MLYAVGIASAIARDGREYILLVDVDDTPAAGEHLHLYEQERLVRPPPPPPSPKLHPHALEGSIGYALVLFFVAFAVANGLWRLDAFNVGELNAGLVQQGQWWRVFTALTLHIDTLHLVSNTVFGMWFGYLASRLIGVGNAWLLVVLAAGFANWVEGYFGPPGHLSVGASTAVFSALGLLSGFSWRTRLAYPQRWALRWAPLVAGIVLLVLAIWTPPLAGFTVCFFLWKNLSWKAWIVGGIWMIVGIAFGAWKTRGFRGDLVDFELPPEEA